MSSTAASWPQERSRQSCPRRGPCPTAQCSSAAVPAICWHRAPLLRCALCVVSGVDFQADDPPHTSGLDLLVSGDCLPFQYRCSCLTSLWNLEVAENPPPLLSALCKAPALPFTVPQSLWDLSPASLHVSLSAFLSLLMQLGVLSTSFPCSLPRAPGFLSSTRRSGKAALLREPYFHPFSPRLLLHHLTLLERGTRQGEESTVTDLRWGPTPARAY